jgi:hypothetical protein
MSISEQRDWHVWHDDYDVADSDLAARLTVVQSEILKVLPAQQPSEPFRFVSICAGQAHDIVGALSDYPYADQVQGRLLELNPDNVELIRSKLQAAGLEFEVIEGDAADTALYEGAVPADLVLAVGIFGNVSDEDVFNTIRALPQFTKPGGTVLWSRGRNLDNEITPEIRRTFAETGFTETAFHSPEGRRFQIGANRYDGSAVALQQQHLFSFRR